MKTTMITGPTAGIGKSLAYQLAERGENLLLVARREDRLKSISIDLETKFDVKVNYIAADLTLPNAPHDIYEYCDQNNLDVSTLILNAGYQINTRVDESSLEE